VGNPNLWGGNKENTPVTDTVFKALQPIKNAGKRRTIIMLTRLFTFVENSDH